MYKLYPYFTNDGSVGLYSISDDDIYHSTYGALSEAYEKFILPADFKTFFKTHSQIKILDICFGIGYNTKAFLNYFFENKKIFSTPSADTIDAIDTDNKISKIFIKAIDVDKNLIYLSPFIKTSKKFCMNNKIDFDNEKISEKLSKNTKQKYKFNKYINIILLKKLVKIFPEIFEDEEFAEILKLYSKFCDGGIKSVFKFYKSQGCNNSLLSRLNFFLHNIYYRYISVSYKKALNALKTLDFVFEAKCDDARHVLQDDKNTYDFIFLDAFTPAKCPALWTVDFFKLLHSHLDDNGLILTYSNSAAVRNAFIRAGFWVGKIYDKAADKFNGTIAAKKLELIKCGLSEYDLGLINSKTGIVYRDENLTLDNEAIIAARQKEVDMSGLQSGSKFIRTYRSAK